MRKLLLLPLFFGLVTPAIAHNEANGGCGNHCVAELGSSFKPRFNSNVERTAETNNYMVYIVLGILIIIIPLVTWRYFTK